MILTKRVQLEITNNLRYSYRLVRPSRSPLRRLGDFSSSGLHNILCDAVNSAPPPLTVPLKYHTAPLTSCGRTHCFELGPIHVASMKLSSFLSLHGRTPLNWKRGFAFANSGSHSFASLSRALKSDVMVKSRLL